MHGQFSQRIIRSHNACVVAASDESTMDMAQLRRTVPLETCGVCIRIEAIGGDTAGDGHEVVIEAVDEEMDDALFPEQRPTWRQRTRPRRA